ncbi:MAG: sigma-70 family RNA polymerase sigma factor [Oscillospiraceae bacterium]|nr:sigma-70 family RNA polymerase sigma factor [Oscillospiraceae bacterium]
MLTFFLSALESEEDRRRFRAVYAQYHGRLERVAMGILQDRRDAEDAIQNTFVQVVRHFEKIYQIPCEELPFWLISIVKNEARMILRKRKRALSLEEDWETASARAEDVSDYAALVELFASLPETYRQVLEMKALLGYTDRETAQRLGISETAVSTRASRGRALLREILEKEGFHL